METTIQKPARLSTKETAVAVRAELKAAFPCVKFSVRSKHFSGGSSVDITFPADMDGKTIQELCNKYQGKRFDGMTDSTDYLELPVVFNGEQRLAGYAWVQCQREWRA